MLQNGDLHGKVTGRSTYPVGFYRNVKRDLGIYNYQLDKGIIHN